MRHNRQVWHGHFGWLTATAIILYPLTYNTAPCVFLWQVTLPLFCTPTCHPTTSLNIHHAHYGINPEVWHTYYTIALLVPLITWWKYTLRTDSSTVIATLKSDSWYDCIHYKIKCETSLWKGALYSPEGSLIRANKLQSTVFGQDGYPEIFTFCSVT